MTSSQTITLSDRVSNQLTGIVLCWCGYNNSHATDKEWSYQFVPKDAVMRGMNGSYGENVSAVHFMISLDANGPHAGGKQVYINDTTIKGNDQNSRNVTAGGMTMNNARWVLRYVLGV